ncbi:MAG: caspase family protein [Xanthobacteraceae bacterium]|jgi:hypothetical protein
MKRIVLPLAALALGFLATPIASQPALAGKHVALVVGNSAYQHAAPLANPARDAKAIAAMFQKSGFEVVTVEPDAGIVEFKRAVRQFEDAAADSDIAVVYYSGHGIDVQGSNYLIPVDAKLANDRDAEDEAVSLERIVESVDGAKELRIVILDACRDKPFQMAGKHEAHAQALRGSDAGLSAAEPTTINTLIAYAAKPGSIAEDGNGEHSPFTVALLDNLFVPGLDIRLAFGRVRDEVLKNTSNKQEPFVYGSLGGGNISIVDLTSQNAEVGGDERDYDLVERIGTARAWQVFVNQHPTGPFADRARVQIAKLTVADAATAVPAPDAAQIAVAAAEPAKPAEPSAESAPPAAAVATQAAKSPPEAPQALPPAATPAKEQVAAIEPANPAPDVTGRDRLRVAQQELSRLGCYSGAADGAPGTQTTAAIQGYENARGAKTAGNVEVTDAFVAELKKQSSRVCPLTCPAGKTAQGDQCVVIAQKQPQPAARPEAQASAAAPRAPLLKQTSASNAGRVGIGIGF